MRNPISTAVSTRRTALPGGHSCARKSASPPTGSSGRSRQAELSKIRGQGAACLNLDWITSNIRVYDEGGLSGDPDSQGAPARRGEAADVRELSRNRVEQSCAQLALCGDHHLWSRRVVCRGHPGGAV